MEESDNTGMDIKGASQEEPREDRLVKKLQTLTISEKIKFAMKGNSEVRGILARESNKLVVLAVLDNPRLTDTEVVAIARNRSVIEDALRTIAKNKEWLKNYGVQVALVSNPKTPVPIAIKLVPGLKKKDLSQLEKDKNVPEAIRSTAKKFIKGS